MTFVRGMRARLSGPAGEDASFFENGPPRAFTAHEEAESLRRWESEKRRQARPDAPTARELTTLGALAAALLGLEAAERSLRTEGGAEPQHAGTEHAFGWDFPTTSLEADFALAASHWARHGGEMASGVGAMVFGPFPITSGSATRLALDDTGALPRAGNSSGLPLPAVVLAEAPQAQPAAPLSAASTSAALSASDAATPISFASTRPGILDLPQDRETRVAEAPAEARPAQPATVEAQPQQVAAAPATTSHHSAASSPAASAEPAPSAAAFNQVAWQWTPPEPAAPATARASSSETTTAEGTGKTSSGEAASSSQAAPSRASDTAAAPVADATSGTKDADSRADSGKSGPDAVVNTAGAGKDVSSDSSGPTKANTGNGVGHDDSPPGLEIAASVKAPGKTTPPGLEVAASTPGHSKDSATDGPTVPPGREVAASSPGHTKDKDGDNDGPSGPPGREVAASKASDSKDSENDRSTTPAGQEVAASKADDSKDAAADGPVTKVLDFIASILEPGKANGNNESSAVASSDQARQESSVTTASSSQGKEDKTAGSAKDEPATTVVADTNTTTEDKDDAKAEDAARPTLAGTTAPGASDSGKDDADGRDADGEGDFALANLFPGADSDTDQGRADATPSTADASFTLGLLAAAATVHPDTIL